MIYFILNFKVYTQTHILNSYHIYKYNSFIKNSIKHNKNIEI